jgi:predicted RNA-binding Zn-ribbon protein involved in translation (DUF1610 family)
MITVTEREYLDGLFGLNPLMICTACDCRDNIPIECDAYEYECPECGEHKYSCAEELLVRGEIEIE